MAGGGRGPQRIMEEGAWGRRASGPLAWTWLSPTHPGLSAELATYGAHRASWTFTGALRRACLDSLLLPVSPCCLLQEPRHCLSHQLDSSVPSPMSSQPCHQLWMSQGRDNLLHSALLPWGLLQQLWPWGWPLPALTMSRVLSNLIDFVFSSPEHSLLASEGTEAQRGDVSGPQPHNGVW